MATTIGTGKYGTLISDLTLDTDLYLTGWVGTTAIAWILNVQGSDYYVDMNLIVDGGEAPLSGYLPHVNLLTHVKVEISRVNAIWDAISIYESTDGVEWVLRFTWSVNDYPDEVTWKDEYDTGEWTWEAAAEPATSVTTPSPTEVGWYSKQTEVVIEDAYRRVTIAPDAEAIICSNGADADYTLVACDITEQFDPTTTNVPMDSLLFSFHAPFEVGADEAVIDAFLATFATGTPIFVEGGWNPAGVYDVVPMGYFFITDVKLNREKWVIDIAAEDVFGRLADESYLGSEPRDIGYDRTIPFNPVGGRLLSDILSDIFSEGWWAYVDFAAVSEIGFIAPLNGTISKYELIKQMTNYCGGRWYLNADGKKQLVLQPVDALDYKVTPSMTFAAPTKEKYTEPPLPHGAAMYKVAVGATLENICEVPQYSLLPDRYGSELVVLHDPAVDKQVYDGTTLLLSSIENEQLYATTIPASLWWDGTDLRTGLQIKGYKVTTSKGATRESDTTSTLDNPLVTTAQAQKAVLAGSFPTFNETKYVFSMRDDPSLKCGNVIQLAVNFMYHDVVLVEAKRTFNGAGRVTYKALDLGLTGDMVFDNRADNYRASGDWMFIAAQDRLMY